MSGLSIELPKLFFTTGEIVHGKILYEPKNDRRIHGIHIHFTGYEFCENNILSDIPYQKKWILDGATTVYGNKCVISRDGHQTHTHRYSEADGVLIKSGKYSWPFSFQIPKNIPPSCEYKNGKVKIDYTITTLVDIPWSKSIRYIQHIRVGLPYIVDPERAPNIVKEEKSFLIRHSITAPSGIERPRTLKIEGWVDKPVTSSGDKIVVHCHIDNNSGRHVQSLKVKLKQLWSYGTGYFEKYTITKVKHKDRKFPLASGKYETDIAMVVPNCDLRPTIQNASLIRISYHITIIGSIRAGGALRVRIPIIVASYPPVSKSGLSPKAARKASEKKEKTEVDGDVEVEETQDVVTPTIIDWDAPVPGQTPAAAKFLSEPLVPTITSSPVMSRHRRGEPPKQPALNETEFAVDTDAFEFFNEVKPSDQYLSDMAVNSKLAEIQNQVLELESAMQWASSGQLEQVIEVDSKVSSQDANNALSSSAKKVSDAIQKLLDASKAVNHKDYSEAVEWISAEINKLDHDAKTVAYHIQDANIQQAILQQAKVISIATQQLVLQGKEMVNYDPFTSVYSQEFMVSTMEKTAAAATANCTDLGQLTEEALQAGNAMANYLGAEAEKINKSLEAFNNPFGDSNNEATYESLERSAQAFASAASQLLISAHGSSKDIESGGIGFYQATKHLFHDTKGIAKNNRHISQVLFDAGRAAGNAALRLLEVCRNGVQNGDLSSTEIQQAIKSTHEQAGKIVAISRADQKRKMEELQAQQNKEELQKEEERLKKEQEEREKELQAKLALENNAQTELAKAAESISKAVEKMKNSIEEASKRAQVEPENVFEPHTVDHKYEVLHASGSVATAIIELLQGASMAQAERVALARDNKPESVYHKDPAWTEGLISASKTVVVLIEKLVEATSSKDLDEEMIVSIARAISAATAQLMSAERAKGDPRSEARKKLTEAARLVASTTSELVQKMKDAARHTPEPSPVSSSSKRDPSVTAHRVQELEAASRIAKLEKELEKARADMLSMRKSKYQS